MEFKLVEIAKPNQDWNVIIGQAHFIKTVEDLYEALVQAVPGIKFGVAFCEASGPCLIRHTGTDREIESAAIAAAQAIGAGHVFNQLKTVSEVCTIFCASANPLAVVVAEHNGARGVMGVIDGSGPKGTEGEAEQAARHSLLRRFGYKQ